MGHGYVDVPIPPACGVPPVTRRGLDAAVETATAAIRGVGDYWAGAIAEARTPLDIAVDGMRWWQIMTERRPPRWATRHRILRRTALTRLRDFSPAAPSDVVPTLVLPPQAGHDSCIVDFSTQQSQMRTIRAVGLDRLYSMDWIGATQATKDATISDYLAEIAACIDVIGGPVNLVGDCQGGWLATIYAALHPENVNTLTIAGAPIDFHAGDAVIHESVQALSDEDLRFYKNMVALGNGVLKGEFLLGGFIAIKPENELVAGTLTVDGAPVRLDAISCPINMLAGATDHITPPAQVFALADHVSTPPANMLARTTLGGHLGLFMGRDALERHWTPLMQQVAALSSR